MNLKALKQFEEECCGRTPNGLPEETFEAISRHMPIVNVDLLIENEDGDILLSWRDDEFCGKGWHIPGGVILYKETFHDTITRTALREIGIQVFYDTKPIHVANLVSNYHTTRGHFVGILFRCYLNRDSKLLEPKWDCEKMGGPPSPYEYHVMTPGTLQWFSYCPPLIPIHEEAYYSIIKGKLDDIK